jgi:hypothetical protein
MQHWKNQKRLNHEEHEEHEGKKACGTGAAMEALLRVLRALFLRVLRDRSFLFAI